MPKYAVYYQATASTSVVVEAEDEEAAQDAADEDFSVSGLCHQCARAIDLSDWEPVEGQFAIEELT